MSKTMWIWFAFAAAALAQWSVPGDMIWQAETTLTGGTAFKFRTAPVDPYDAFRGRYVALGFANSQAPITPGQSFHYGQDIYALLENGADGFARFSGVTSHPPANGAYLKVRSTSVIYSGRVSFALPFDRFYVPEQLAPAAERAYREHSRLGAQDAYAIVRVREGVGLVENVYIAGKPLLDFAKGK
jgi:hypothetical protein